MARNLLWIFPETKTCCCFFKLETAIKIFSILYFISGIIFLLFIYENWTNEKYQNLKIFCLCFGIVDLIVAVIGICSLYSKQFAWLLYNTYCLCWLANIIFKIGKFINIVHNNFSLDDSQLLFGYFFIYFCWIFFDTYILLIIFSFYYRFDKWQAAASQKLLEQQNGNFSQSCVAHRSLIQNLDERASVVELEMQLKEKDPKKQTNEKEINSYKLECIEEETV